jgi:hypothetical protein
MKSKRFSNIGGKGAVTRRKPRRTALHAKNLCSKAHKFRLALPKCPSHLGRTMAQVGVITRDVYVKRGKKVRQILGYRFRCPVPQCPACATILVDGLAK